MSARTLERWSGFALLLGAAVAAVAHFLYGFAGEPGTIARYDSPAWIPAQFAQLVGVALILLGLPAVYGRQSQRLGVFGLVAFALIFVGMMSELMGPISGLWTAELAARPETRSLVETRATPAALGVVFILFFPQLLIGGIAFGASVIRARVFSRVAGALLIAGVVLDILGAFILRTNLFGGQVFFAGLAWLGLQLAAGGSEPQRVPQAGTPVVRSA